ncbi:MAG TPA: DUF5723 family protein [Candidatus Kryptonia bacterium]
MKKIIAIAALAFFPLFTAYSQQYSSARLISLGGLATAVSTDVDAIGTNPANLLSLSRGTVVVEFVPFNIAAGSDFLNVDLYNNYFTGTGQTDSSGNKIGRFLTEADKQSILNAFPNGVGQVRTDVNVRILGVSVRTTNIGIGFAVDEKVGAKIGLPNSLLFPLDGNPPGSTISLNDLATETWWYRSYNVDYAMRLPDLLIVPKEIVRNFVAGIGLKYVTGFSYTSMQSANSSLHTDSSDYAFTVNLGMDGTRAGLLSNVISKGAKSTAGDTTVNFNPLAPAGTGFGFDLGMTATVYGFVNVGISLTDIGWLTWNKNVVRTTGDTSITFSGFSPANATIDGSTSNLDSLKGAFNDYFKNRDVAAGSYTTSLPTKLNIGASVALDELFPVIPGQLLVAIDYHQGFNNYYNNSTTPELVLGTEWKPIGLFPLRTGIGLGGAYGFRWSLGFGINLPFWDIDLGVGTFNTIAAPNSAKYVSISLSILKFRF